MNILRKSFTTASSTILAALGIVLMAMNAIGLTSCSNSARPFITVTALVTDNMENPLGLDEVPVFGWTINSNIVGVRQLAYQIEIYEEGSGSDPVWNTGKIESGQTANVELDYSQATRLKDETNYVWKLTVWDNQGNEIIPEETGSFSTGLAYELCTYNNEDFDNTLEATFGEGATYIGNAEIPLDADALTAYRMSYDFQIEENGTEAGFVYGANDYRLSNAMYNDFLIEGENYMNVVVDISQLVEGTGPAQVKICRKGYGPQDYEQDDNISLLAAYDIKNLHAGNMYEKHSMSLTCGGANLTECTLDGLGFMPEPPQPANEFGGWRRRESGLIVNPTGLGHDMCKYPRLNDIGFYADGEAIFSNVSIRSYNVPRSEVFGAETGATYGIFEGLDGITVEGDNIYVSSTLAYADPSYGSEPMVRTEFETSSSSGIVDAKLYVTSRGLNQFYINGRCVESDAVYYIDNEGREYSRDYLTPGMIQFYGTMRYSTYDVAYLLKSNDANAMGAIMAPGWWGDEYVFTPTLINWYGEEWGVLAKLVIRYEDGTRQVIVTNEDDWKSYLDGPITYSSIYHGEYYDATKESNVWTDAFGVNGWSTVEYDDSAWTRADYATTSHAEFDDPDYEGRVDYPGHVVEVLTGKLVNTPTTKFLDRPERKVYIYDMGENIVGVPEVTFKKSLPEGAYVTLRYGETMIKGDYLYPENAAEMEGMIYTENYRGARSLDRYIAKGAKGGEKISPSFTFHGWQYLEVSILSDELTDKEVASIMQTADVRGLQLSSVNEITTTFESSNELLDRFFLNVARSHYDNNFYVATDCPQRNERLPFLGDQQIYSETSVYMGDMTQFYSAFAQQARDYQVNTSSRNYATLTGRDGIHSKKGVKHDENASESNIAWPMGGVTIAWDVFANNSDLSFLREHWNSMVMFVQQFINAGKQDPKFDYLFQGGGLSNHLDLTNADNSGCDQNAEFGRVLMYMATMAKALGYEEEAAYYKDYFKGLKAEFNEYMISEEDIPLSYEGEEHTAQSSYAIPLYYDMVDLEKHPEFVKNYVERCKNESPEITTNINGADMQLSEYSVTSGFTGTACILGALAKNGEYSAAYKMLENEKYASWLYPVTLGARSIWERWNTLTEFGPNSATMNSFNHYAFATSAAFMITNCAGIQRGDNGEFNNAGFRHFILQPAPGGSLEFVNTSYKSVYGTIESNWTADPDVTDEHGISDMTSYSTVVPANTMATLYLPLGTTFSEASLEGFNNSSGVTFVGITTHNSIDVAEFEIVAGGYDFEVVGGKLTANLQKDYANTIDERKD